MRIRATVAALSVAITAVLVADAAAATHGPGPITISGLTSNLRSAYIYVDPALRSSIDELALQRAAQAHPGDRLAVLTRAPLAARTAAVTAEKVRARLKAPFVGVAIESAGTVTDLAGASSKYTPSEVAYAATLAQQAGKASVVDTLRAFADNVAAGRVAPAAPKSSSSASSPWIWIILVALLAGLGTLIGLRLRARERERRRRARGGSIGTARSFHIARLDHLSHRHGELVSVVASGNDDPTLAEHHQTAGAKLVALRRQLPGLFSPRELRTCARELDEVEWHLEAAEAIAAKRSIPPHPGQDRPGLCFFTHEHGLGTVEIDLIKPDGSVGVVFVCPANAAALHRGEPPIVSQVHVGGRMAPWPAAPSWYGAPGWSADDLPGLEYEGREIWGRAIPRRDGPIEPGDQEPPPSPPPSADTVGLPPGVSAPAEEHDDTLPPGVTPPAEPPQQTTTDAAPPASEAAAAPEPPAKPQFEELEGPPPAGLVEHAASVDETDAGDAEVTADHPAVSEPTQAYDPFADDLPAWERSDEQRHGRDR
jgi:hypothetical protein